MQRPRSHPSRVLALVALGFLAQALLPRASWYAHRHADGAHGHVHAWDGAQVGGSTGSLRDLLPAEHGHDHGHDDAPGHAHDHAHGALAARHEARAGDRARDAGEPHRHVVGASRRDDAAPDPSHVARAERTRPATGPAVVGSRDDVHHHVQHPFQTVAASGVVRLAVALRAVEPSPSSPVHAPGARAHTVRARAPPRTPVSIRSPQFA